MKKHIENLEEQFFHAQAAYCSTRQELAKTIAKTGMTPEQWQVLRIIGGKGKTDCRGIASETPILGPSISRILNKLKEAKLIKFTSDSADFRRKIVSLSDAGKLKISCAMIKTKKTKDAK